MNWKNLLTNPFKKKKFIPTNGGRKPKVEHEPILPKLEPKDAVKAIPEELVDNLRNYKSALGVAPKLTEDMQLELMEFIARYATQEEIQSYFVSNYGVSLSTNLVYQYKKTKKWQPIIQKLREKYLLNTDDVAISHKRVRLDRAEKASQLAMKKDDERGILHANADAREEIVGKSTSIGSVNMQFNGMTYEEIQEQKKILMAKLFPKVEIKTEVIDGPNRNPEEDKK